MKYKTERINKPCEDDGEYTFSVTFSVSVKDTRRIAIACMSGALNYEKTRFSISKFMHISPVSFSTGSIYDDRRDMEFSLSEPPEDIECVTQTDITSALVMLRPIGVPMYAEIESCLASLILTQSVIKTPYVGPFTGAYKTYENIGWEGIIQSIPKALEKYLVKHKGFKPESRMWENPDYTNQANEQLAFDDNQSPSGHEQPRNQSYDFTVHMK